MVDGKNPCVNLTCTKPWQNGVKHVLNEDQNLIVTFYCMSVSNEAKNCQYIPEIAEELKMLIEIHKVNNLYIHIFSVWWNKN